MDKVRFLQNLDLDGSALKRHASSDDADSMRELFDFMKGSQEEFCFL
jgi:hypothetical protein